MAIEKRTFLYELLVRFHGPSVTGVQVIDLEELFDTDTGEILSSKRGSPKELDQKEVGDVLGAALAPLQAVQAITQERDEARAAATAAMARLRSANEQIQEFSTMLEQRRA
jgi:hypothetical protein